MYHEAQNSGFLGLVYCLLVNRAQFLREQTYRAHHQTVNLTRALLCELVANRVLRRFDEANPGRKGLLLLANILVAGFDPFQSAPPEVIRENNAAIPWAVQNRGGYERKLTALEIAIVSESKSFLSSTGSQKVVNAIYQGRITYTPTSFLDILPDHYKHKPISLYDPSKAPLLDQYRLTVPRTRTFLDVFQFLTLLALYLVVMSSRDGIDFTKYELLFMVYTFGWVLEQFASILEHGWHVYTQNLWAFLDSTFCIIYGGYLVLRLHGLANGNPGASEAGLMILATAAPILIPRLAFNLMSENMLFISLRDMMADFAVLTMLAVWCFAGFLLSMGWLCNGSHQPITISKWMLWVWFGLDGTGIQRSGEFHWLLGPILMVTFAFLGNTLFLTIFVSMLSNTFAVIASNATAEIHFRRAVLTFEGVKSDAIFAFPPPFNVVALLILLPLKLFLSPRWFHKINVLAVRIFNAPLLFSIGLFERRSLWATSERKSRQAKYRSRFALWNFSRFSVHGDIQAVFDIEPPQSAIDQTDTDRLSRSFTASELTSQSQRQDISPNGSKAGDAQEGSNDSLNDGTAQFSETLHEYHESINLRFEALEDSIKRIGNMVQGVSEAISETPRNFQENNQP